jgi:hypothetical protein
MEEIRFDDVAKLQTKVTEEWGDFGGTFTVSQEIINQFADLTGDHNWIHVDVEKSKELSPFGGPIAHGFLTLSLMPQLGGGNTKQDYQVTGFHNVVNYGSDKLRFTGPVPSGSEIHMRSRLVGVEAKPKGTQVTSELAIHVVGNERPAIVYQMIILYQ